MSWVHSPKNDSWNKEYEWIWLSNTTEMGASESGVYSQNDPTWIGNWRQAIGFGLYSIFKHSNKPIYLAKRKQTMCDQQSANQPTLSCDISWLSIQLHNNAATTTIIEMYGHFEPCWKAVGCFRTKIWIRKGHQLCRVRNFMLGCPAGAQTYAHTHWTLTYIICLYIYTWNSHITICSPSLLGLVQYQTTETTRPSSNPCPKTLSLVMSPELKNGGVLVMSNLIYSLVIKQCNQKSHIYKPLSY